MTDGFDALPPADMARRAEAAGEAKAAMPWDATVLLALLGGAFIGLGAAFSLVATAGVAGLPFGAGRVLVGTTFSLGLVLVVVGGAELFTGNNLIVIGWASGRVPAGRLARNWALVYVGNAIGATATAALCAAGGLHRLGHGAVGDAAVAAAHGKLGHPFAEAFVLGVLANALVCLAVWLAYSARSTTDRILAVVPPVTAFVAAGFEHSIANLFVFPFAAFAGADVPFVLVWAANLIPVTLGNVAGGAGLVGLVYWRIYLRGPA